MDFQRPENNLPPDWDARGRFKNDIAAYHMERARIAIGDIRKIDPLLAQAVADAILHSLLAVNIHNHRMFPRLQKSPENPAP